MSEEGGEERNNSTLVGDQPSITVTRLSHDHTGPTRPVCNSARLPTITLGCTKGICTYTTLSYLTNSLAIVIMLSLSIDP